MQDDTRLDQSKNKSQNIIVRKSFVKGRKRTISSKQSIKVSTKNFQLQCLEYHIHITIYRIF